jgi:hypothetical protein
MKADGLFVIMAIVFIFVAWVATGGPTRPISSAGLFITPVTRSGEESQGYRYIVPTNPIDTSSYPTQIAGNKPVSTGTYAYSRTGDTSALYIERSVTGPSSFNPNQEYISLVNGSASDVTIRGWSLASRATGTVIMVPPYGDSLVLHPGEKVIVLSGRQSGGVPQDLCTSSMNHCVFLNRNLEAWAASRETIKLFDNHGSTIDSFSY